MVDLDPIHKMRSTKEIFEDKPDEQGKPLEIRIFRRTSYFVLLVLMIIVVIILLNLRQPPVDRPDLRIVDLDVWEEELALEGDPLIIDIREDYKFEESRIPGAIWGERSSCFSYGVDICATEICDARRNWYFYSNKGEEYHEIISAINVNYTRQCWATVYMLEGGFEVWEDTGNEMDYEIQVVD